MAVSSCAGSSRQADSADFHPACAGAASTAQLYVTACCRADGSHTRDSAQNTREVTAFIMPEGGWQHCRPGVGAGSSHISTYKPLHDSLPRHAERCSAWHQLTRKTEPAGLGYGTACQASSAMWGSTGAIAGSRPSSSAASTVWQAL